MLMYHERIFELCWRCVFVLECLHAVIPPNNDAYGVKMAMNDVLLVQAQNEQNPPRFLIQFASSNGTEGTSPTTVQFPDPLNMYIYAVAVGKRQISKQFFFAGELINGGRRVFLGFAKYQPISSGLDEISNTSWTYSIEYLDGYEHFLLDVDPQGLVAYGFANRFLFRFDSRNTSNFNLWNGNLTWPDRSFLPYAVDLDERFGVIAGFVKNDKDAIVKYNPIVYLLDSQFTVVDRYEPGTNPGTWQALLTNADANTYSAKYTMSIDINRQGDVLVGMQFVNRVLLFSVDLQRPVNLTFVSRSTHGRSLGNGKAVAWLDNGLAAVLVNSYSLNYQWSSSEVHLYDISSDGYNSTSPPYSVYPNNHQLLPQSLHPTFVTLISSPSSLALLDAQGNIVIFNPTPAGFYPSVQDTGIRPLLTTAQRCVPGTYKNRTGIQDCRLCPTGTRNSGDANVRCRPCSSDAFCSLGAVDEVPRSVLGTVVQAMAYPKSSDSTVFDEILIEQMFSIKSGRCLFISPLFWTLIIACLALVVIVLMSVMKFLIPHPESQRIRRILKRLFKQVDLINEGELWVGGLASLAVLVLASFAFAFSREYLQRYPIESSSDSSFFCHRSIRNAKFETNLQSLAIPFTRAEQQIADLLNHQPFVMKIDFVNTFIQCDTVSIQAQLGITWSTLRWLTCENHQSILSLTIALPYQHFAVQVTLADAKTIGALRLGLTGAASIAGRSTLKALNFSQSFALDGQLLASNLPIALDMTKVINETLPMTDEQSDFAAMYIPTFNVDIHNLFLNDEQYIRLASSSTTLTVVLGETPYYVKNTQQPIAKQSEMIFHNILFFIVCLELFGLVFLSYKLVLRPLVSTVFARFLDKLRRRKGRTEKHDSSVLPFDQSSSV